MKQTGARDEAGASTPSREPGRLRAAWAVLRGERLVPAQIQAEWAEYQLIFSDMLQRWSAMQARAAKLERARLARMAEDRGNQVPTRPVPTADKAALRSMAAQKLGLGPYIRANAPTPPQRELHLGDSDS